MGLVLPGPRPAHRPPAGDQDLQRTVVGGRSGARAVPGALHARGAERRLLSHPNIVTIHDVMVGEDGTVFIAMEYIQGTDLKQLMQRPVAFDARFVVDVVGQIAVGLEYAHGKGVVHRDIKPANIILTAEKQAKITDFGIVHLDASNLTTEGELLGTPNYMSPEMIAAERSITGRTSSPSGSCSMRC